jgi:hypothetical protein
MKPTTMVRNNIANRLWIFNLIIFMLVCAGLFWDASLYAPMLGDLSPLLIFGTAVLLFPIIMVLLSTSQWVFDKTASNVKIRISIFLISMLFGCVPVVIDLIYAFPRDINVLFPQALVYYPTIGFLAEVVFHLMPLLLLSLLLKSDRKRHLIFMIVLVAMVEPVFQIIFVGKDHISIREVWVGIEVFVFSLFQLFVYRKYGFLTMYLSRMGFYLSWHLIWGQVRLIYL